MSLKQEIEEVRESMKIIEQESFAKEILQDYKKTNKRMCVSFTTIIVLILCMWFATIGYLVYVLNDIGVVEETTQEITDFDTINGNVVNNGDIYGED